MKRSLIGDITVAIVGAMTYGVIQWEAADNQKRDA